ncbi:MAG: MFS transporter, partial [Trebonia sp.]
LWHLLGAAVVVLGCTLIAVRAVPTLPELGDADATGTADATGPAGASIPATRVPWRERLRESLSVWADLHLILIGVVMLGMAFAEGSAGDWLPLAVVDGHHQSNAAGAITFGVFMAAMTIGRVAGGPVVDRFGRVAAIRATSVLGVVGLLIFILTSAPWLVILGTVLWGLGASLGFPLGMSAAADDSAHAAARVSAVAMIGYCAFLVGPPLIGFLGQTFGLLNALFVILVLLVAAGLAAPAVRQASRARTR